MAVDHVVVAGGDFNGDDVAGDAGGEGELGVAAHGAVFGHEEAAAAHDALEGSEEAAAAGELGVGGHLDIGGHPGELAGFGDDGVVGLEEELEDGHGGADDLVFHDDRVQQEGRAWNFGVGCEVVGAVVGNWKIIPGVRNGSGRNCHFWGR